MKISKTLIICLTIASCFASTSCKKSEFEKISDECKDKAADQTGYYCKGEFVITNYENYADMYFVENGRSTYAVCYDYANYGTDWFYENYSYINDVVIPEYITIDYNRYDVTGIFARAFSGCVKLRSVVMAENVDYIEENAFTNCANLREVYLQHYGVVNFINDTLGTNSFPDGITIYVPERYLNEYRTAYGDSLYEFRGERED